MKIRFAVCGVVCAALSAAAFAGDIAVDISEHWVNVTPPGVNVNAAYMQIQNNGDKSVTLSRVTSPQFGMAHLHETFAEGGHTGMRALGSISIDAGETLQMQPGGMHVMLMHAHEDIVAGASIQLHLVFTDGEDQREVVIDAGARKQ